MVIEKPLETVQAIADKTGQKGLILKAGEYSL